MVGIDPKLLPESVSILPQTARTKELLEQRALDERQKREDEKRRLAEAEAEKERIRQEENDKDKRLKMLKRKEEQERNKKREADAQRSQLHGGLGYIFQQLHENRSAWEVSLAGFEMTDMRLRVLCGNMAGNKSCHLLDLNRQNLVDSDGEEIANMLRTRPLLGKLTLEGNHLGVHAATHIFNALEANDKLLHLSMSRNALTNLHTDTGSILALERMLRTNTTLRVLDLSCTQLSAACVDRILAALAVNPAITHLELWGNQMTPAQAADLQILLERNRKALSAVRRRERYERITMQRAEDHCRKVWQGLEELAVEVRDIEAKRLVRMRERLERWRSDAIREAKVEKDKLEALVQAAEERRLAKKKKKKKSK